MNKTLRIKIAVSAFALALFAGCGGDDKVDECMEQYHSPLMQALCMASEEAAPPTGGSAKDSGVTEYEPNNSLNNANVMSIDGAAIDGSVQQGVDSSDFFIFTPPQTGEYTFSLVADSEVGYVMIYDQSQTTIASSSIGDGAEQEVTTELVAGMAYYIEVNGYNADVFAEQYQLSVDVLAN